MNNPTNSLKNKMMDKIQKERNENNKPRFDDRGHGITGMAVRQIYDYLAKTAQDTLCEKMIQLINQTAGKSHAPLNLINLPRSLAKNFIFGSQLMVDAVSECCLENDGGSANVIFAFADEMITVDTTVNFAQSLMEKKANGHEYSVYTWGELIWLRVLANTLQTEVSDFHAALKTAFNQCPASEMKSTNIVNTEKWAVLLGCADKQYEALENLIKSEK